MTWLAVIGTVLYYCTLPIIKLFQLLLIPLAPLQHLGRYALATCLWPLTFAAKFETLYIYLGVAAVIGLSTGFILHVSSALLVSVFDLKAVPDDRARTAASVRAQKKKDKLEEAWYNATSKDEESINKYDEWLDQQTTRRGDGVLGQTILEEEDDDSEDQF